MTTLLLILLASLAALLLAFLFFWAFWRANHLDENTKFLAWLKCEMWKGQHRPARHPMGGYRCLDCLMAGDLSEMGLGDGNGYVDPKRKTYESRRGA